MSLLNIQFGQTGIHDNLSRLTEKLHTYGTQLSTGKKGESHSDYAMGGHIIAGIHQQNNQASGYLNAIDNVRPTMDMMYNNLERMKELSLSLRQDTVSLTNNPTPVAKSALEARAKSHLEESISIYNSNISGKYLFSGRLSQQKPVENYTHIINGDAYGRAGLQQIVEERLQADLGTNSLGRLALTQTNSSTLTIAKDAEHDFGFNITSLRLPDLSLATISGNLNEITLDFSTMALSDGQKIDLSFELPNGETHRLSLIAQQTSNNEKYGFSIGNNANETMESFKATITNALTEIASTQLSAASMYVSGQNFFDPSRPVQRISGNDPYTATTFENATEDNTVLWYKGEIATETNPENRRRLNIDENYAIGYAVSADELPLRENIMMGALLMVEKNITDSSDSFKRQVALSQYISQNIMPDDPNKGLSSSLSQFASILETTASLRQVHSDMMNFTEGLISEIETADINEVSVRILDIRTRLEASYKLTSILSEMSLVNYL